MDALTGSTWSERRWSFTSAGAGAVLWLMTPWLSQGPAPSFASIEHVFLLMPLTAAPLAIELFSSLLELRPSDMPLLYRAARRLQPAAALLVLASFFVAKGPLAGALTAAWLLTAVMQGAGGMRALVAKRGGVTRSTMGLVAGHIFLPIGAVWLMLSRLGVGPRSFAASTVLLAAVHFHFSGYLLQLVIAATGRALEGSASRLRAAQRGLPLGAIAGIALIAAGNALGAPLLKGAGVTAMVVVTLLLAAASASASLAQRSPVAKTLVLVSAGSVAAAMILAGVYGAGELLGRGWIDVPSMAKVHGLVNAVGFTLCSLTAHLLNDPGLARIRQDQAPRKALAA